LTPYRGTGFTLALIHFEKSQAMTENASRKINLSGNQCGLSFNHY